MFQQFQWQLPGEMHSSLRKPFYDLDIPEFRQLFEVYDQRRFLAVSLPTQDEDGNPYPLEHLKDDAKKLARGHFYDMPYNHQCEHCIPVYISIKYIPLDEYDLRLGIKTILRSHLVEVRRLKDRVDVCTRDLSLKNELVFKYYYTGNRAVEFWNEVTVLLALPAGLPGVLPVKHLVLDETTNDGVVGFTTPFMPGGDLGRWWLNHPNHPIKLDWLRQLMAVVDRLNLEYNLCHAHVRPHTVLLNNKTDKVYLCSFGIANPMHAGDPPNSFDDVKGVVVTVFWVLAGNQDKIRDLNSLQANDGRSAWNHVLDKSAWILGASVRLEDGVTVGQIYDEVMEWARGRCSSAIDEVQGSRRIPWKSFPGRKYQQERMANEKCPKPDGRDCTDEDEFCGEVLDWTRPDSEFTTQMPPGRRLLASRRNEDEGAPPYRRVCLGLCPGSQ